MTRFICSIMTAIGIVFDELVPYRVGVRIQDALVTARITNSISDVVLFLEHKPVITLGVRADEKHIILSEAALKKKNIQVERTSRGGDVTWHGPGQIVMYPIIKLGENEADAHGYLQNLEEIAIRTADDFGIQAFRRKGMTGAWTHAGKLAAIGIRLKRWVTFHGMSFNVNPDFSGFAAIIPCGLAGQPITSLQAILGKSCPSIQDVRERLAYHFSKVCRRKIKQHSIGRDMPDVLSQIIEPHLCALSNKNYQQNDNNCYVRD